MSDATGDVRPGRGVGAYPRSALVGATFAVAWTPCVGPVLAGILTLAAASGTAAQGSLLLVAYALGLGVPFVAAALALASWPAAARRLEASAPTLRRVGGVVLVVTGAALVAGLTDQLLSPAADLISNA